ncbi:hypothetical protein [Flavobacterium ginsenosidimutans]|uniref:Uncharacterized protein n=1 Tax=Flavobacterium ginsenosidimutans TaxID=687844 RepID=A0ABZ2Q7X5_9FLAO
MGIQKDEKALQAGLKEIDLKIDRLNDQKITALFDALGLAAREDLDRDFLKWDTILVVVPSRSVLNELKKYKDSISRISFIANPNAQQIHIYDFNEWKSKTQNKSQFKIREFLKTNFGGVQKISEDPDWIKSL